MPDWHDVKVVSPKAHGKDAYVEIDGVRMKGVRRVVVDVSSNDANHVTIEMFAKSINLETEVEQIKHDNGMYRPDGTFIHLFDCKWGGEDHIGRWCLDRPDDSQPIDEP